MPLKLNFGSGDSVELLAEGDLAKYLQPGIDTVAHFSPQLAGAFDRAIANAPAGSLSTKFDFTYAPSWTVHQAVPITLTVQPEATCKISILKPGDAVVSYFLQDGSQKAIKVSDGRCYVSIEFACSLALAAGAEWSSGNLGVSGNISSGDQFRVATYHGVAGSLTLREAISEAFSNFVLPFHSDSIEQLPDGDYVDFEFIGKLALGFGATYGFSGLFLAGRTNAEVSASFTTPIGKSVISAKPSFQAGASFQFQYTHRDAFRIVAGRENTDARNGAVLYLLRKASSGFSTSEDLGITFNAGGKFETDPVKLQAQARQAGQQLLEGQAGELLGNKLASAASAAVGAINDSVNKLLAKGDGRKITLELLQSRARENTALFIFKFDFAQGTGAYDVAMRGDFATTLTLPGVELDPESFVERVYTSHAGLNLQFFDLLQYQQFTEYIKKTDITYLGSRTFQIRDTVGVKSVAGLFGKEREADLYFIAQCRTAVGSVNVSEPGIRLHAIFIDQKNRAAFDETARLLRALGVSDAAERTKAYLTRQPEGPIQLTLDLDGSLLKNLRSDEYLPGGKPPEEPHLDDQRNYEAFARAVSAVIGSADSAAQTFEQKFATYKDWLAFNRTVTDQPGSIKPGDRLSEGNPDGNRWPEGYPPRDRAERLMVQTYILAGQHFMNFCDSLKHFASTLPGLTTDQQYDNLLRSIAGMIRREVPFPAYFLKPGMVALTNLLEVRLAPACLPDPNSASSFALSLKPATVVTAAGG